ncbi:hypothetical protein, partial [Burkholderia pseudomallei]|uniref:hypothetical protein n=1 Tax=Burkholderia pseudomallei TaxID=28450 RepID=UPI0021F7A008
MVAAGLRGLPGVLDEGVLAAAAGGRTQRVGGVALGAAARETPCGGGARGDGPRDDDAVRAHVAGHGP